MRESRCGWGKRGRGSGGSRERGNSTGEGGSGTVDHTITTLEASIPLHPS